MEGITDTLLVTAARGGDRDAYGELFARYQSRIYNYAYGIAGNREDAADIAQEAFVKVFEALPRLTGELNFSAYVYRTTHNVAIDSVKGRSRFDTPDALDLQAEPSLRADPERVALVQEQQRQAWQAAFGLSDDHRAILTLRELHDLSYQEIAEIMDMPRNTVGVLLSRARLRFKEAFRMSSIDIDKLTAECQGMLPLLSAYIDDELDDKKRARVESHLEECAFCRLALEEMTESSRSYRAILPLLPPAALGEGLWGRLGDLAATSRDGSSQDGSSRDGSSQADSLSQEGADTSGADLLSADTPAAAETAAPEPPAHHPATLEGAAPGPAAIKSAHRYPRPRLLAYLAGGAVIVALITLTATGVFGGSDGSGADGPLVAVTTGSTAPTDVVATTTAADPTTETTPNALAGLGTEPPGTIEPAGGVGTVPPTASSTASTRAPSTTGASSAPETTAPSSTTVTEARDTTAPPTPGIIYPAAGDTVKGSKITLRWKPVTDPSGVTYRVDVESFDRKAGAYIISQAVDGIRGSELTHVAASDLERWRVTAVDGAGNSSKPSAWAKFANPTFNSTPATSTTTTLRIIVPPSITILTTTTTFILY